ncbi:cobalamin binding intrinsic factor-like [Liasis olivaceus]
MFLFTIILCAFCVTNTASISSGICSVPSDHRWLVRGIQTQLENWASLQSQPDPSVLIALNLAEDHNLSVITQLVRQIKETAGTEMSSGKVALYVLALRSSCQNPTDVSTPEKHVNLVQVLEKKTKEEIKHIHTTGTPKTTYYQLALDTLALCVENSPELETAATALAKAALANSFQLQGRFSVDTAAMASLALFCVYEGRVSSQQSKLTGTIQNALALITKQILDEQQNNGILGNIHSTGLAMQALSVTSEFDTADPWNCEKTIKEVLHQVTAGAFSRPAAASQILPSLAGKTYLDVRGLTCTSENGKSWTWQFLSGNTPLEQGVGSYKPKDNEQIVANFTRY